jgi:hypothetical protein
MTFHFICYVIFIRIAQFIFSSAITGRCFVSGAFEVQEITLGHVAVRCAL